MKKKKTSLSLTSSDLFCVFSAKVDFFFLKKKEKFFIICLFKQKQILSVNSQPILSYLLFLFFLSAWNRLDSKQALFWCLWIDEIDTSKVIATFGKGTAIHFFFFIFFGGGGFYFLYFCFFYFYFFLFNFFVCV